MTRVEIEEGVRQALAEVLDLDLSRIALEHRVVGDLGADSLDLLDLMFQLEQRFGVRFKAGEIERRARERLGDIPLVRDGAYTSEALRELRAVLPEVPEAELAEGLRSSELPRAFRVVTFVNLVEAATREQA